ncbi:unnamed protein product, partial [Discosporangium mesarthrocarpum]
RSVLPSDEGHFRLSVTHSDVTYNTSCISYGAMPSEVADLLSRVDPIDDLGGATVSRQGDGSSGYSFGYTYSMTATNTSVDLSTAVSMSFLGSGKTYGCARLTTYGEWDDVDNWNTAAIPDSSDDVFIPVDSGLVALSGDVTVATLELSGGAILTHTSSCPEGWAPAPAYLPAATAFANAAANTGYSGYTRRTKCWHLLDSGHTWENANAQCTNEASAAAAAVGQGTDGEGHWGGAVSGRLAVVQGLQENQASNSRSGDMGYLWVSRLCRADPLDRDCWIGLAKAENSGEGDKQAGATSGHAMSSVEERAFKWIGPGSASPVAGDVTYRAWDRWEPNNQTHAEGGEDCATIRGGRWRPLHQVEGRWNDELCSLELPSVCQAFGSSTPYSLTVTSQLIISGGYLWGSGTVYSQSEMQVSGTDGSIGLLNGVTLVNSRGASCLWSAPVADGWGGTFRNEGSLNFTSSTISLSATANGGGFDPEGGAGAWPVLLNRGGETVVEPGADVDLEWLLWNEGGTVKVLGRITLSGAGYSTSGKITVGREGEARFWNSSFAMEQRETAVMMVQAEREVTGEDVEDARDRRGHYRLSFAGGETNCIPYHASAKEVQAYLEELSEVMKVGGVDVTKDGHGADQSWGFGYRQVKAALLTSPALNVSCSGGGSCGCNDVISPVAIPTSPWGSSPPPWGTSPGRRLGCGSIKGNASAANFNPSTCLVSTTVGVSLLHGGGETSVTHAEEGVEDRVYGTLTFSGGGRYALPPSMGGGSLKISGGAEVVCAQWDGLVTSTEVNVSDEGVLWFAGGDLDALDAVALLHAPPSTPGRSLPSILHPPAFNATVKGPLTISDQGEVRLAGSGGWGAAATVRLLKGGGSGGSTGAGAGGGNITLLQGGGVSGRGRVVVEG